jgi:hypothetical protein
MSSDPSNPLKIELPNVIPAPKRSYLKVAPSRLKHSLKSRESLNKSAVMTYTPSTLDNTSTFTYKGSIKMDCSPFTVLE